MWARACSGSSARSRAAAARCRATISASPSGSVRREFRVTRSNSATSTPSGICGSLTPESRDAGRESGRDERESPPESRRGGRSPPLRLGGPPARESRGGRLVRSPDEDRLDPAGDDARPAPPPEEDRSPPPPADAPSRPRPCEVPPVPPGREDPGRSDRARDSPLRDDGALSERGARTCSIGPVASGSRTAGAGSGRGVGRTCRPGWPARRWARGPRGRSRP